MTKTKSSQAAAAAMIRKELKKHGIKATVRSSSFAGGTSVDVTVSNLAPWVRREVEAFVGQFEYGHFDGMYDIYEYSNCRDDIPQVKFVFVNFNKPRVRAS